MSTTTSVSGITFGDGSTQNTATYMAANNVIFENNTVISANASITAGRNGLSAGPVTINNGITLTIPTGSTWTVL